ncbi:Solute carrier organic anion transporter family member 1C1, partial [Manacus vitellinus]
FLAALSFSYFSKALSGVIMKSSITQIERRFDLTSSTAGFVDGSFEIGNLLVIAFVSYFGAKLHRPKVIAVGCITMALGCFLSAMPHFFMGYYKYEAASHRASSANSNSSINPCSLHQDVNDTTLEASRSGKELCKLSSAGCEKEPSSNMWIYILLGNMLRGIGETPVTPLGISYLDDFAKEENVPVYVACLHTIAMLGPMFGFLLGSLCAKLYVDIGFVDPGSITITPQDSRWVGAWWLGFLIAGTTNLLSAIPFCFLPKSLKKPEEANNGRTSWGYSPVIMPCIFQSQLICPFLSDFCTSLKKVLSNRMYFTLLCCSLLQFSSFVGFITYKPKYMEQQYGQSTSKSNFLIGVTSLPPVGIGIFLGGVIMKKYKMGIVAATKFSFIMSFLSYAISFLHFFVGCENYAVAGMTVSYEGFTEEIHYYENGEALEQVAQRSCGSVQGQVGCGSEQPGLVEGVLSHCRGCWSKMMFRVPSNPNHSSILGSGFPEHVLFLCLDFLTIWILKMPCICQHFILIPLSFRCVQPQFKALAVGLYTLVMRTLAGVPAPVYFGAVIDRTCLKWGSTSCGQRGACRLYDSIANRYVFLGLAAVLRGPSFFIAIIFYILIKKHFQNKNSKPIENGQEDA